METRLILVGGFLGAGKTTLLWETARRLAGKGRRVGLITNDQAPDLVDTALLARSRVGVEEVAGSCFCCNFEGLLQAMSRLRAEAEADVLVAEPVGSCTDLSATILQPLKEKSSRDLVVAPLSVLVDPARLADILDGGDAGLHPSAAYILRKQIEEADILLISKADTVSPEELRSLSRRAARTWSPAMVRAVSSVTGEGLDEWLDLVMTRSDGGLRIAEVDYDVYAEGEAVLGWLNATFDLAGAPQGWSTFARRLLEELGGEFEEAGAAVGHVKLLLEAGGGFVVGNLTGGRSTPALRGSAGLAPRARMTLNARVETSPGELEEMVRRALQRASGDAVEAVPTTWNCLSPGRPEPTHRYDRVVETGGG